MALNVVPGGVYPTKRVRAGEGSRGKWELIVITDPDKQKKDATVFATNPEVEITEGQNVKIVSIDGVTRKAEKDRDGNWKKEDAWVLNCTVERVAGFEPDDGDDLPPWDDDSAWGEDALPL